jgi:tRNA(adenine34) deaminase
MKLALKEANKGKMNSEVPIGAIIVINNKIIARGHNIVERKSDPTAHAEMVAIRKATKKLSNWRLNGAILYVTDEPCMMCVGATYKSRISTVVYGCENTKSGALGSVIDLKSMPKLNHKFTVIHGILENECKTILKDFFSKKRKQNRRF